MSDKSVSLKTYGLLIAGVLLLVVSVILVLWRAAVRILISLLINGAPPRNVFFIIGLCVMFACGVTLIIISINNIKKLSNHKQ